MPLALWQARLYWQGCHQAVELDELIGVAMEALTRAAAFFDPERGLRFSTLATISIQRALRVQVDLMLKTAKKFRPLSEIDYEYEEYDCPMSFWDKKAPDPARRALLSEAALEVKRRLPKRWFQLLWVQAQGLGATEVARRLGMTKQRVQQLTLLAKARARRMCPKGLRP
jgi:DNA-directed RNA polymerase specialized sigma subunit